VTVRVTELPREWPSYRASDRVRVTVRVAEIECNSVNKLDTMLHVCALITAV